MSHVSLSRAIALLALLAPAAAIQAGHAPAHPHPASTELEADAEHHHHHLVGGWMLSYRLMSMTMDDLVRDNDSMTREEVVTQVANPHPGPATVRVVPQSMQSRMHMLSAMYAYSNRLTFMAMAHYLDKDMNLTTYAGMMGTDVLGDFSTQSAGVGDTKLSLLWGLHDQPAHKIHLNLGISLPTGSIEQTDEVLSPMNMRMSMRLPYGMQLGSGTWDLEPGLTYNGYAGTAGWGAHYRAVLRLGDNDADYSFGDQHQLAAWGSIKPLEWLTGTLRLNYTREGDIDGQDAAIAAPVTTANPANYGGERVNAGVSVALTGQSGALRGHKLQFDYDKPLSQDLNGVQLEMDSIVGFTYQYTFQ